MEIKVMPIWHLLFSQAIKLLSELNPPYHSGGGSVLFFFFAGNITGTRRLKNLASGRKGSLTLWFHKLHLRMGGATWNSQNMVLRLTLTFKKL